MCAANLSEDRPLGQHRVAELRRIIRRLFEDVHKRICDTGNNSFTGVRQRRNFPGEPEIEQI